VIGEPMAEKRYKINHIILFHTFTKAAVYFQCGLGCAFSDRNSMKIKEKVLPELIVNVSPGHYPLSHHLNPLHIG